MIAETSRQKAGLGGQRITSGDLTGTQFYQLHKFLFTGTFKTLSNDARVLYALLRDRFSLSLENEWVNDKGEVYLIYTREHLSSMLGCSVNTVRKAMNQLKLAGLLDEERMGVNRPNRIYLSALSQSGSGHSKFAHQDTQNLRPNYTDINKTDKDINNTSNLHSTMWFLNIYESGMKEEIEEYLQLFYSAYKEHKGKEHPRLKKEQLQNVYEVFHSYLNEYGEGMNGAIEDFFTTVKHSDHNINHFVSLEIISRLCERNK